MRVCSIFGDCRQCHAVRRTCAVPRISCRCAFSPRQQPLCLPIRFDLQRRRGAGKGPHAMACCSRANNRLPQPVASRVRAPLFVCLLCSGGRRRGRTRRPWRWRRRPASGSEWSCPSGVQLLLNLRWRVAVCVHRGGGRLLAVLWAAGRHVWLLSGHRCRPAALLRHVLRPLPHTHIPLLPCYPPGAATAPTLMRTWRRRHARCAGSRGAELPSDELLLLLSAGGNACSAWPTRAQRCRTAWAAVGCVGAGAGRSQRRRLALARGSEAHRNIPLHWQPNELAARWIGVRVCMYISRPCNHTCNCNRHCTISCRVDGQEAALLQQSALENITAW